MKFSDLFVPKYLNSNPDVRIQSVNKLTDVKLLDQIAQKDEDRNVCRAAANRAQELRAIQQHA
ncbi:MAG: hypothetical protein V1793_04540 [Pseudomonadota bacterium]